MVSFARAVCVGIETLVEHVLLLERVVHWGQKGVVQKFASKNGVDNLTVLINVHRNEQGAGDFPGQVDR